MIDAKTDVRVEVEETRVVLVFPSRGDNFQMEWQDAYQLGEIMETAAGDVPNPPAVLSPLMLQRETEQVRIGTHQDRHVFLFYEHTDRLYFSREAAVLVGRAIKMKAQDLDFLLRKKVRFVYNKMGQLQSIHNHKSDTTQIIPGR